MKSLKWINVLVAGTILLASCAASGPPSTLAFNGDYDDATILVTVILPDSFTEYQITCSSTEASIDGTNQLNAADACASLSQLTVQERLGSGRDSDELCSDRDPEEGQVQFLGVVGQYRVNTFVNRKDSCGRREWDNLLSLLILPVDT